MNIRKITGSERFDAFLISTYCFHVREEDTESKRESIEKENLEDWGAFDDDGTLMAHIINNKYEFYLDGKTVKAGGIGAVSTLPEYRESGAIKEIFKELLKDAYKDGEVISALYPFSHFFYRKFGYDTVVYQNNYEFPPAILKGYKTKASVKMWKPGESVNDYLSVYNSFAKEFNFAMPRNEEQMLDHMKVDKQYKDRKFSYLFTENGENIAYLIFKDVYNPAFAILEVEELAYTNISGFNAILAFFGRFGADYGKVTLPLPGGVDLNKIVRTPGAYEIQNKCRFDFMVRVINVSKLLETINKPSDTDFVIKVSDDYITENNGIWRVTSNSVKPCDSETPDITVDVRTLGQLATGCITVYEALFKSDIEISSKEEMLERVFTPKKIMVSEHF